MDGWTYTKNDDGSVFISRPGSNRAYLIGTDGQLLILENGKILKIVEASSESEEEEEE